MIVQLFEGGRRYNPQSLAQLTAQDSGVIVYPDGDTIICNWSGNEGLPRLLADGLVYMGEIWCGEREEIDSARFVKILNEEAGNRIIEGRGWFDIDFYEGTEDEGFDERNVPAAKYTLYKTGDLDNNEIEAYVYAPQDWC